MRDVHRSALVPYSAEQMFELVGDIESYPQFLPWCADAEVHERDAAQVRATLEMHKAGISRRFTTVNRLEPHRAIDIALVDGPFSHLSGGWRFEPRGEGGCRVDLRMRFQFANPLTGMLLGAAFEQMCNSLVDAFARRARSVYGAR